MTVRRAVISPQLREPPGVMGALLPQVLSSSRFALAPVSPVDSGASRTATERRKSAGRGGARF